MLLQNEWKVDWAFRYHVPDTFPEAEGSLTINLPKGAFQNGIPRT
jgi:hypothetical protein